MSLAQILSLFFFRGASFCSQPYWLVHAEWKKMLLPRKKNADVFLRLFRFFPLLCFLVLSCIASPLGFLLHALAVFFQREPYHVLPGRKVKVGEIKESPLSFFSQNICAPWGGYPMESGVLPWRDRIDPLLQEIRKQDADIVALQEVFDNRVAFVLYECLKNHYSHFCLNIGHPKDLVRANSGLFLASKKPLVDMEFVPFPSSSNLSSSKWINRGFFGVTIADGPKVYLVHLQHSEDDAAPTEEEKEMRKLQIEKIVHHMSKEPVVQHTPFLLMGDCNLYGTEFQKSLLQKHFQNFYQEARPTWLGNELYAKLWNQPEGKKAQDPYILDYVLLLHSLPSQEQKLPSPYSLQTRLVPTASGSFACSDHEGLFSQIIKSDSPS